MRQHSAEEVHLQNQTGYQKMGPQYTLIHNITILSIYEKKARFNCLCILTVGARICRNRKIQNS